MASVWLVRLYRSSAGVFIFRQSKPILNAQHFLHFSTSSFVACKETVPVKYTTNKAAKVPIRELIGLEQPVPDDKPFYEKYVILLSIAAFLIYFCILREENDIDEILRNPTASNSKTVELLNLKSKLIYCKKNNLPTDALRAKIEELEKDQKYVSPFAK